MADNEQTGTGKAVATDKVTYSGDADQNVQLVRSVAVSGSEGSKTVVDHTYDNGVSGTGVQRVTIASDSTGQVALAAGTAAIGKLTANSGVDIGDVDVLSIAAGDNNIGNVDIVTINNVAPAFGSGVRGATVQRVTIATDDSLAVTNAGTFAVQVDGSALTALQLIDDPVYTDDAAFSVASGKVMMQGANAVAHGANPDAADAADACAVIANRHRIPFVIGGHPNAVCFTTRIPAASGAQTDLAIGPGTVNTGAKVVVTRLQVTASNANTVNVAVKVGFGATSIPADTATATGSAGILADHEGVPPGGGFVVGNGAGMLGVGADGEELRFTCDSPTGGHIIVSGTYYTIES